MTKAEVEMGWGRVKDQSTREVQRFSKWSGEARGGSVPAWAYVGGQNKTWGASYEALGSSWDAGGSTSDEDAGPNSDSIYECLIMNIYLVILTQLCSS